MNRITNFFSLAAVVAGAAFALPVASVQASDHAQHAAERVGQAAPMAAGEVLKVDKDLAKITIKHGPLVNLNMPGMTMPFKVKDPAMLDQVKMGDKVSFFVEKVNGLLTITRLDGAK